MAHDCQDTCQLMQFSIDSSKNSKEISDYAISRFYLDIVIQKGARPLKRIKSHQVIVMQSNSTNIVANNWEEVDSKEITNLVSETNGKKENILLGKEVT